MQKSETAHLRNKVRIISYFLALLLVMGTVVLKYERVQANYERMLENGYQRAFAELAASIDGMNTSLEKSLYVTSPMLVSALCTDIYGKSVAAQMCLEALPFAATPIEKTAGFIARTGDYAYTLSRLAATGQSPDGEKLEILKELCKTSKTLAEELLRVQADMYSNGLSISDASQRAVSESADDIKSVTDSIQVTENDFPELPSLIYDGPFSEHVETKKPTMLENKNSVTQNEGAIVAADFLNVDAGFLDYEGQSDAGRIPAWTYSCAKRDSRIYIQVTKQAGRVLSVFGSFETGAPVLGVDEAVNIANMFLMSRGFGEMQVTYTQRDDGSVTINYAPLQDGVLLYPDLVKVKVALDDGSIIGFDAIGYLSSHKDRVIPTEDIDPQMAEDNLQDSLRVLSSSLCIIPTAGGDELFCREFKCETPDGRHCLVYVNALTGSEEKLLLLIENENGTLTI